MSEVGKGKLVVGILQNMDIASNILNAINFDEDQKRLKVVMAEVEAEYGKTLSAAQELTKFGLKDGYTIVAESIKNFPQEMAVITQINRNQLLQSTAGYHMTANMMASKAKFYAQNNWTDLEASIIFDMPETYIREKVSRFYNNLYRQAIFPAAFATDMYNRGKINKKTWTDILAQNGIPDKDMLILLDAADKKPEMSSLLRMYQYIDMDDKALDYMLTENGVTMSQIRTLWKNYFHANRLRDEMLEYKQYLKRAYQDGLITSEQLEVELTLFKASQEEIDAIVDTQEAEYNRTLIRTEFETRLWLYRKGIYDVDYQILTLDSAGYVDVIASDVGNQVMDDSVEIGELISYNNTLRTWLIESSSIIAEDSVITITDGTGAGTATEDSEPTVDAEGTLYEALRLLGVQTSLINATVRLEAAKKGINWEQQ